MSEQQTRELVAEFIGTLMLVLVGAGAVVMSGGDALTAALAHGLILVAIIATYGHISGAHVNPAVSLALWIAGRMATRRMVLYMGAQFLGALVASVLLLIIIPEGTPGRATLGQTTAAAGVNELDIILVEALLTFFLVSSIFQVALYGKGGVLAPVLIGFTLAGSILLGGPLTGASLNPARTLGPALLAPNAQDLFEVVIYMAGIFGGGALAAFIHMDTFKTEDPAEEDAPARKKLRRRLSS
ncbi:MAG: hypothetical protein HC915_04725 [Anaerolineae bacterium]|nr:hypothetical protein [Anaerolineae bacterium]